MRNKCIWIFAALILLLGLSVNPVAAELLSFRSAKGNNVGLGVRADWASGGPFSAYPGSPNTHQFPKGSGNLIFNDGWGFGVMATQDLDGDGLAEDTTMPGSGRSVFPFMCSIDSYDMLAEAAATGAIMEIAAAGRDGSMRSRVWSSLDDAELANWPTEAREGHSPTGAPVLHGTETIYVSQGDVFGGFGGPLSGFHLGYNLYFLDFGQSNNMVYSHLYIQNVSEYMVWNHKYGPEMWTAAKNPAPSGGWTWNSMMLYQNWRQIGFGQLQNMGWAYHPAKGIHTLWSKSSQVAGWTPQEPPLFGMKVLKNMELNGEQAELLAVNTASGAEFGFSGTNNLMAQGWSNSKIYRTVMNVEGNFTGQTSPFTEKQVMDTWPGKLTPEDSRYNQWLWGGDSNWNHYTFWGELHDVAPRDTLSFDWVLMFSPTGVTPMVAPKFDIDNIDDPMMQQAFSPQEEYAAVAQTVFEGGYQTPATPIAPALTIVPGDREVTLTWSDINLKTPDPYFDFLQGSGLDPAGLYRELDFEGFRLYRSFVGPNDSHSEVIWEASLSAGDVQFFYIDQLDDDFPLRRMRNGLKVWYALVPYDKNVDVSTGESFSLPDPAAGKTWNRAGEAGLYNVVSRSNASEFKAASWDGQVTYTPAYGTPNFDDVVTLAGNGDGTFAEAPVYRAPVANFEFKPVLNEKLTTAKSIDITTVVDNWKPTLHGWGFYYSKVKFQLSDGGTVGSTSMGVGLRSYRPPTQLNTSLCSPITDDGADYAIDAEFLNLKDGNFRSQIVANIDAGGYTGANAKVLSTNSSRIVGYPPSLMSQMRSGRFTLTWSSGGEGLTLAAKDVSRDYDMPFAEYPDQYGWGIVTSDAFGNAAWSGNGQLFDDMLNDVPQAERTAKMVSSLPADYTGEFGVMVNGVFWLFQGTDGVISGMPSSGTVMTIDNVYGSWNADKTEFNQFKEPPWPGDKWSITIQPSTMNPEDADLSKIKVVPNPYIASSYLDLSSTQRRIEFINLPANCTVRIYSLGGNLVNVLNHIGSNRSGWGNFTDLDRMSQGTPKELTGFDNHGGTEPWNLRNRFGQTVASGLYFYHVTDIRGETFTGKFYVVN